MNEEETKTLMLILNSIEQKLDALDLRVKKIEGALFGAEPIAISYAKNISSFTHNTDKPN